jgi:hypothetical protein
MRKTLLLALLLSAGPLLYGDASRLPRPSHAGETATVCGNVAGIHPAARGKGKPTFINFDKRLLAVLMGSLPHEESLSSQFVSKLATFSW